jgi:hypothetical protein
MSEQPMPPVSDPASVPVSSAEPVTPASARSVTGEVILELRGVHTYYGKIQAQLHQGQDIGIFLGTVRRQSIAMGQASRKGSIARITN